MRSSKRGYSLLSITSIAIIIVVIYYNSLNNSFHYDDYHSIVENSYIRGIKNIPTFFITTLTFSGYEDFAKSYRPLLLVSYTLNYYLGGLEPYGYHIVNIIIHIMTSILLYLILKRMTGESKTPFLSSLIFAIHPFNTDAVNYITARSSLLSSSFYLLSFLLFIYFRLYGRLTLYFLFLLSFAAALLSKEVAITLPILLLIYDWYFIKKEDKTGIRGMIVYLPFILSGVIYLIIRKIIIGTAIGGGSLIGTKDLNLFYSSSLTAVKMIARYLHLLFLPIGLSAEHHLTFSNSIFEWPTLISLIMLSLLLIISFILSSKSLSLKIVSFFILWFLITLTPILILPFTGHRSIFQENRGYLSGIGFAVISGVFLGYLHKDLSISSKRLASTIYFFSFCLLIIFYCIGVVNRNSIWRSELTLWSDVVKRYPMSYKAYHTIGMAYQEEKMFDRAIEEYKKVLSIRPDYYLTYTNLGNIYYQQGKIRLAKESFQKALSINPDSHKAHFNLGILYRSQGRFDIAIQEFKEVLRLNPNNYDAHVNLGFIYQSQGRLDLTLKEYEEVVRIDPTAYEVLNNIGVIYIQQNKRMPAIEKFKDALRINPDYIYAHINLGRIYARMGEIDVAIREYQEVLRLDPKFKGIKSTLQRLYEQNKRKK